MTQFLVCNDDSLVGLYVQNYKSLCATVTIYSTSLFSQHCPIDCVSKTQQYYAICNSQFVTFQLQALDYFLQAEESEQWHQAEFCFCSHSHAVTVSYCEAWTQAGLITLLHTIHGSCNSRRIADINSLLFHSRKLACFTNPSPPALLVAHQSDLLTAFGFTFLSVFISLSSIN